METVTALLVRFYYSLYVTAISVCCLLQLIHVHMFGDFWSDDCCQTYIVLIFIVYLDIG